MQPVAKLQQENSKRDVEISGPRFRPKGLLKCLNENVFEIRHR